VAAEAPCKSILFNEWRFLREGITTFSAKEVSNMPLCSASHHHLTFYWCLTALASWAEKLMEVKMAVESQSFCVIIIACSF
jgi:hypothetical protein